MTAPLRDVPQEGIELIKSFEGIPDGDPSSVNLDAYLDPVGIWTIGWGHAITYQGLFLRGPQNKGIARALYPGGITIEQAEMLLRGELVNFARDVLRLAKVPLDDGQFASLVSFAFNCGPNNLGKSTLLRKLNQGDYAGAADQFLLWNKARKNGALVELPGLTRRRRAERAMFLGEDWRAASGPRTRGAALPAVRTMAPERPEPPPDQDNGSLDLAAPTKKARRPARAVPASASPAPAVAAAPTGAVAPAAGEAPAVKKVSAASKEPAAGKAAGKSAGKNASETTRKAVKPTGTAAETPIEAPGAPTKKPAAKPAKPRARTTTPKAPPKTPPAKRPAQRTKR